MSQFDNLIYDRTQSDIEYRNQLQSKMMAGTASAEEILEWNQDSLKGSYNYTDINRVGNILILIKSLSDEIGMRLVYPNAITTTYTRSSVLSQADIQHLLENVEAVKTTYSYWITTTVPTSIKTLDAANSIEWLLAQVEPIVDGTIKEYKYSGELYSGGF